MKNKTLSFVKYSGNGNDFIILDHPSISLTPELVQQMCDRHFGIGGDGVVTLTKAKGFDGEMRIYNADGGEAEMCGNGLRCLVTFMDNKARLKKDRYVIKTMNNVYTVMRKGKSFAIEMSEIKDMNMHDLSYFNGYAKSFYANTGVPHLVFLSKDVKFLDIKSVAPTYRHHTMFPGGTNVNFLEVTDPNAHTAYVRTFERGVEDETHSCGTGLTASALALSHWFGWQGDIVLNTLGGEHTVQVGMRVLYSGEVFRCFKGEIKI